ncbi:hypothetical protein J7373_19375 [Xanthomonas sp. A2111]|uniref:Uncharacterized protein n=1 Tax=Xanthomonas hawaiiensis TaxID=3003247 RepID=A0ABU2I1D5_9XANT|nr:MULTISPECIES: hypothetical protein [unclassified Xanthomonas]MBO9830422.1 hypothetical protein [Xanthomonas sp. A2111]MBO9874654.1 hypothetical protein [Xanthomonas sp. D-93]MDS9991954.1 hypothetical protein [Xanthomonas sp. A2111]WNH43755.1 hypothetical protein PG878_14640 [Xanthomonas sp. A6251]
MARPTSTTASPSARNTRGASAGADKAQKGLSRERIEADLAAFHQAGGRVEVLGTTRVLKKVDVADAG